MSQARAPRPAPRAPRDGGEIARGALRGFLVLVVGELVLLAASAVVPPALLLLQVLPLVAFTAAAWVTTGPLLDGGLAAAAGYLLTLPLVLIGGAEIVWVTAVVTSAVAVLVGVGVRLWRRQLLVRKATRA